MLKHYESLPTSNGQVDPALRLDVFNIAKKYQCWLLDENLHDEMGHCPPCLTGTL